MSEYKVLKFGGTSLGSIERIKKVAQYLANEPRYQQSKLVVVVSAMSGETNRLISLIKEVRQDPHPMYYDLAISAGEQVSSALMSAAFQNENLKALPLLAFQAGIVTTDDFSSARIEAIDTTKINQAFEDHDVVVIAGFQGNTKSGRLTTLGRGGTDTTAVAVAAALGTKDCEIFTDVDGIFSANPSSVSGARLMRELDYETMLEMASLGSKVLHTRCVELAAKYKINVTVRNTLNLEDNGTMIREFNQKESLESPIVSGVSALDSVAKVSLTNVPEQQSIVSQMFAQMSKEGINIDIIVYDADPSTQGRRIGFSVMESDAQKVSAMIDATNSQNKTQIKCSVRNGFSKVSVVGLGMRSHPGVAAQFFRSLEQNQVEYFMISTSEIKISALVKDEDRGKAEAALHKDFIEQH